MLTTTGRDARRGSFGPGGGAGMPTERSKNFGLALRRLGTILGSEAPLLVGVLVLTVASVGLVVLGPRLLGQATDIIVSGVTGDGIDFGALHRKLFVVGGHLPRVVVPRLLAGLHPRRRTATIDVRTAASRSSRRSTDCRSAYIDQHARGDLLSRVTNDIDNLAQSLQQTTSQILTSLLTLIGVIVMMFVISPLLAAIALVTVPTSVWLMKVIGGSARPRFMAQWRHTGQPQRAGRGGVHRACDRQELRSPARCRSTLP